MESALCLPDDPDFRLIETFLWTPEHGVQRRDRHLARLARSAARLGLPLGDSNAILNSFSADSAQRARLTMDRNGVFELIASPFAALPDGQNWVLSICADRLSSDDPWLTVKSTQRTVYNEARAALPAGVDEIIFLNERHELCEGTITNIFVDFGDGLLTPPISSGLLPGILRDELISKGEAKEQVILADQLQNVRAIYVGNSLRGLIRARLG